MFPIKQLLFTFAPSVPIQITLEAVVMFNPAEMPKAVLESPLVLAKSAPLPMAVLEPPVVLPTSGLVRCQYLRYR
jgi:hypothetical protein